MRFNFKLFLVLLLWTTVPAQATPLDDSLASAFDAARDSRPMPLAALGVVVAEAESGKILYARQADAPMMPASVLKLATSVAALSVLGSDFRFETKLCASGSLRSEGLEGDLVLVGGGDPTLTEADLAKLARDLGAQVSRVKGNLFIDASLFASPAWEPGWTVDDLQESYAPLILALGLAPGSGSLNPELSPGEKFQRALQAAGITLEGQLRSGNVAPTAQVLARHVSVPLSELLSQMNKASLNAIAEALFRMLGSRQTFQPGTATAGSASMREQLTAMGIASGDIRIADGSGLSRYDLITPRALAQLLVAMNHAPAGALFHQSLPVAGVDGTLAKRFGSSRVKGRFHAKTGTMSGVSALAGYLEGTHGRRYALVLLANGFTTSVKPVQGLLDDLVERFSGVLDSEP